MKLNNKGETLVEALCTLAILTLVMFSLPSVLVSANKLNKAVKDEDISYKADKSKENEKAVSVKVKNVSSGAEYPYSGIQGYVNDELYFYDYKE